MPAILLIFVAIVLSGCTTPTQQFDSPAHPNGWVNSAAEDTSPDQLAGWWKRFDDPVMNRLVDMALKDNPDLAIAAARIEEARGILRSTRGTLFPSLTGTANGGRQETIAGAPDRFFQAGFDAAYEVDLFGKNRNATTASELDVEALQASERAARISLVAEVARTLALYRAANKNLSLARKNANIQRGTMDLVTRQFEVGEAPRLDVERARSQFQSTRASIPEFERQSMNAAIALTGLTGAMPQDVQAILQQGTRIPAADASPVLIQPATILNNRPDVRAAQLALAAAQARTRVAMAEAFPSLTLSGFFGVAETGLINATDIWTLAAGSALSLIDFGRIEGQIDAAEAREIQAYQNWRRTVLTTVQEVETALNDHATLSRRHQDLIRAYDAAAEAFFMAQDLFKAGEVSFLDVLQAQGDLNAADMALVGAELAKAESIIRLYKALGSV